MQLSVTIFLTAISVSILLSTVMSSPEPEQIIAIKLEKDEDPILPKEPMVIKVDSSAVTISGGRVEYRGCYKFCVGSVSSYPYNENNKVWNPFNQSTNQVYYFRYVDVDMKDCQWPRWAQYPGLKIPELFFATTSSNSGSKSDSYDQGGYNHGSRTRTDVSEGKGKYVLSYPTNVQNDKFNFLIYHPEISPRSAWTVRWTGFMNTCKSNGTLPIELHYEPDAFDAREYINFQKWP